MKLSGFAAQFPVLWGTSGSSATVQYPLLSGTGVAAGRATVATGFPAANFTPPEAGGIYPWGADWNGALKTLSVSAQNYESGLVPVYSSEFATSIGGYPLNALVADPNSPGVYWVSTSDSNTSVPGASGASWQSLFSGYMRLSGDAQTSSSPTTFNNGLYSTFNVTDWSTDAVPNAVTIGANFLSKTGNQQTSSSPTTFNNGLWSTDVFYVSLMEAVGSVNVAYITLGSSLRCGAQTVYVNNMALDGSGARTITGATNVSDQWNFGTRPNVIGEPVALLNDLAIASTDLEQHFIAAGVSSGSTITFPTSFSGVPVVHPQIIGAASVTCNLAQASGTGSFTISISATGTYSVSVIAIGAK